MGWLDLERRQSPENPATSLSNPAEWAYEALGSAPSTAGVSVTPQKAMNVAAWRQAVDIVAKGVASVPLLTYERLPRGRRRATDTRAYHVLHIRPNPEVSAFQFHHMMATFWASWQNAYAEIEWRNDGQVEWLWPLLPNDCRVVRTGNPAPKGLEPGTKYVAVRIPPNAAPPERLTVISGEAYLPPGKYIHVPGLSLDGLAGQSLVHQAKDTLGRQIATAEHSSRYFGQGAQLATIVSPKEGVSIAKPARENLQRNLARDITGLSQAHRIKVVEAGLDFHTVGVDPAKSQLIESLQDGGRQIAQFFDIPTYRMGLDKEGQSSYASVEMKQLDLAQWTHLPNLQRFEQVYTWELMPDRRLPMERRKFFAEFLWTAMLRADAKSRAEAQRTYFNIGVLSRSEIRQQENLNPNEEDPFAEEAWAQINMAPASMLSPPSAPEPPDTSRAVPGRPFSMEEGRSLVENRAAMVNFRQLLGRSQRPLWRRISQKLVQREVQTLRRLLTKARSAAENQVERFDDLVSEFYERFEQDVIRDVLPIVAALVPQLARSIEDETGRDVSEEDADKMVRDYATVAGARHVGQSQGQIGSIADRTRAAIPDASPAEQAAAIFEALDERFSEWEVKRPDKIANGDSTRAMGALSRVLYAAVGTTLLVWAGGDCELCSSLNGTVVGVEENFVNAGQTINAENQTPLTARTPISHPPLHPPECDCVILAAG